MRFTVASFILPALVAAQNAFNVPQGGYKPIEAGSSVDLKWTPTTGGTVTLVLRSGSAGNLSPGTVIQANVDNSGSYTWKVPSNLAKGDNYAIQIIDDQNNNISNYTPALTINSNVDPSQASSVTGQVSLSGTSGSASSTPTATDASSTATDASSTPTTTGMSSTGSMSTGSMTMRSSSRSSSAVSTIPASSTGAGFRAMPTGVAGAVGAVVGAAAFIL